MLSSQEARLRAVSKRMPAATRRTTETSWTTASTVASVVSASTREEETVGSFCAARPTKDAMNHRYNEAKRTTPACTKASTALVMTCPGRCGARRGTGPHGPGQPYPGKVG